MEDRMFEACIRQIQAGEKEGLKQIYQAYVGLIYFVVYDMTGRKEDAQDITSEFFIRLWDKADSYHFGGKHKAWLLTIARNMTIDFLRKAKREILTDEDWKEGSKRNEAMQGDVAAEVVGQLCVAEMMQLLKPSEQEILDMKIIGGFTFQEIADVLNRPLGTVTWLYRQGIGKLRKYYEEQEVQG